LLGAEPSATTVHFAAPLPVFVQVQPAGASPVLSASKLTVSALAETARAAVRRIVFRFVPFVFAEARKGYSGHFASGSKLRIGAAECSGICGRR
jgi:hypothetical protein